MNTPGNDPFPWISSDREFDRTRKDKFSHNPIRGIPSIRPAAGGQNTIVGKSAVLKQVLASIEQVALTDMTVLILGETGTGKELVARALHEGSPRKNRPLISVNCSALPGNLIESELFGHERGAFTGAATRQLGRFELAHDATIFLDEIGDLPLSLQAKLLRVLQDGEFERLGSGKTIKVDTRVIAATNCNLPEAVSMGRFRADLYYRLNVYPIPVPALRERREDIPLLAQNFLAEAERRLGRDFGSIAPEVVGALLDYDWPGNVRELQNVIQRAAVTSTAGQLQLPEGWGNKGSDHALAVRQSADDPSGSIHAQESKHPSLEEMGRKYIVRILQQTGWRIEGPRGAAEILGLKPSTLRARMVKLRIQRPGSENQSHFVRRRHPEP